MLDNACKLAKTDINLLTDKLLTRLLLYGDHTFNDISNQLTHFTGNSNFHQAIRTISQITTIHRRPSFRLARQPET